MLLEKGYVIDRVTGRRLPYILLAFIIYQSRNQSEQRLLLILINHIVMEQIIKLVYKKLSRQIIKAALKKCRT